MKKKQCSKCKKPKAVKKFNKDRQKADGLCAWCTDCRKKDKARYYQNNAESIKAGVRAWRKANPERKVTSYRNSRYKLKHGEFESKLQSQDGKCGVCRRPFTDELKPNVDHDHNCCPVGSMTCGKCTRGLLCHSCNKALGYMKDSVEFLQNAINYIQGANGNTGSPTGKSRPATNSK